MELTIILCVLAYLIGSIPFGLLLSKVFGHGDIRKIGSGNIGATNVLRSGNKSLALATLIFDVLKGAVLISFLSTFMPHIALTPYLLQFGLFAILGHCFPIWLKFKGGKGVATTIGALLAAVPYVGLIACAIWLVTAFTLKISSLAALMAIGIAPIAAYFIYGGAPAAVCLLITALVFYRHQDNIKRLMKGEESKISFKKKDGDESVSK